MKKNMLKISLIFLLFFTNVVNGNCADFRKTSWGDSKKKVIAIEKQKPDFNKNDALGFNSDLVGIKVSILYRFESNKLVTATVFNNERHTNPSDYIEDYYKFKELLAKKYGEPFKDEITWKNDIYKEDPQHWGLAIATGHLTYFTGWKTDRSYITLVIDGDRYEVKQQIAYYEKKFLENTGNKLEQKNLDQL